LCRTHPHKPILDTTEEPKQPAAEATSNDSSVVTENSHLSPDTTKHSSTNEQATDEVNPPKQQATEATTMLSVDGDRLTTTDSSDTKEGPLPALQGGDINVTGDTNNLLIVTQSADAETAKPVQTTSPSDTGWFAVDPSSIPNDKSPSSRSDKTDVRGMKQESTAGQAEPIQQSQSRKKQRKAKKEDKQDKAGASSKQATISTPEADTSLRTASSPSTIVATEGQGTGKSQTVQPRQGKAKPEKERQRKNAQKKRKGQEIDDDVQPQSSRAASKMKVKRPRHDLSDSEQSTSSLSNNHGGNNDSSGTNRATVEEGAAGAADTTTANATNSVMSTSRQSDNPDDDSSGRERQALETEASSDPHKPISPRVSEEALASYGTQRDCSNTPFSPLNSSARAVPTADLIDLDYEGEHTSVPATATPVTLRQMTERSISPIVFPLINLSGSDEVSSFVTPDEANIPTEISKSYLTHVAQPGAIYIFVPPTQTSLSSVSQDMGTVETNTPRGRISAPSLLARNKALQENRDYWMKKSIDMEKKLHEVEMKVRELQMDIAALATVGVDWCLF